MIRSLGKRVRAELALHRHNKQNKTGVVSPDAQDFYILEKALPSDLFSQALEDVSRLKDRCTRSDTSWRRGAAIGGHQLKDICTGQWFDYLLSETFVERVRAATGINNLTLVPEEDTNRLSLLLYQDAGDGDGIDWHVDGSIYLGQRWAGILVLVENTEADTGKLELAPNDQKTCLPKEPLINSLVLFRGDHVRHRVRPMQNGEERAVLSLLFSDWPVRTINPMLRRYQSRVNQAFYNDPSF